MYPLPDNEADRLEALNGLAIMGTSAEVRFDAICRTGCVLFDLPMCLVTLVGKDQQWFKAKCGIDADGSAREDSICTYAILSDAVLVVEDAREDPRFRESAAVTGAAAIRFYAGAPLIIEPGIRVGTVCVLGTEPRGFSSVERAQLRDLAEVVTAQLYLHRAESRMRDSETHYRLLADNTSDMIVLSSLDSTRRYVSPAVRTLLGYEPEELVGTRPLDQVHPDDADSYGRVLADIREGRVAKAVSRQRYRRKDGSWVWVEVTFNVTREEVGGRPSGYVASVRDISERKDAECRIAHMARHDALTDLANRTLFRERLIQELAGSRRRSGSFAVLSLDLDRFKAVNDTLGHQAGDTLLRMVADRLRSLVRAEDTVARIGGDEFTILQTGSPQPEDTRILARRLIKSIGQPFHIDGRPVDVGVSIGITIAGRDDAKPDEVCRQSDLALHRAKIEGRNTYRFYEPGMRFAGAPTLSQRPDGFRSIATAGMVGTRSQCGAGEWCLARDIERNERRYETLS